MAVHENYLDSYVRSITISLRGKSDEAQIGALLVVQGLLRFARGLKKKTNPMRRCWICWKDYQGKCLQEKFK